MRYAIVSDIHANRQAWNAVLLDIRSSNVDLIICLGDIVGYGPAPAEVMSSVHGNVDYFVLGNHDAVICGKLDDDLFNAGARRIIQWTRDNLGSDAVRFLKTVPLSLKAPGFRCTHGDFSEPAAFNYVIDPEDAQPSWEKVSEPLLFVGHTHDPRIFVLGQSGTPRAVEPQDFALEKGKRFLVNVGSVGQPRDGDARASYCILDTNANAVYWRRIPFDLDAYRAELKAAGLTERSAPFLRHDPRLGKPPLREQLNFSPATRPDQQARHTDEVREIEALRKSARRWKWLTLASAVAAVGLAATGGTLVWRYQTRRLEIPDPLLLPIEASRFSTQGMNSRQRSPIPADRSLVSIPPLAVPAGQSVPGWTIRLGNRRRQSVSAVPHDPEPELVLQSEMAGTDIMITSAPIGVKPGQRFRLYAEFRKSEGFAGSVAVYVHVLNAGSPVEYDWLRNPPDSREDDWLVARKVFPESTEDFPAGDTQVRIQVRGKFKGTIRVRRIGLARIR